MDKRDFSKKYKIKIKTVEKIAREIGDDWYERIVENPYQIMEIEGFGFIRTDEIAKKMNYDMKSPNRIKAYVVVAVDNKSNGNTIVEFTGVFNKIVEDLDINDNIEMLESLLSDSNHYRLLDKNKRKTNDIKDIKYITLTEWYETEKDFFNNLKSIELLGRVSYTNKHIENALNGASLNTKQRNFIDNVLSKNINILLGNAGTGKTFTTKTFLNLLDSLHITYTLLAPTGMASNVISENTGRVASTIHMNYYRDDACVNDYIVIDEFSMLSVEHLKFINKMIQIKDKPPRLLFIGDSAQLPPIGAGNVAIDTINMVKSGVIDGQIFQLTKIMRQASSSYVPYLAGNFREGNFFDTGILSKKNLANVKLIEICSNPSEAIENISTMIKNENLDFIDTVIVCAQNISEIGNNIINSHIQSLVNKNDFIYTNDVIDKRFKINDYVLENKNSTKREVTNGDRFIVLGFDNEILKIKRISDDRIFYYDEDNIKTLSLAYSLSIHKLQGSGYNNVICTLPKAHSFSLNRNAVYTAMTRTKEKLWVFYEGNVLYASSFKSGSGIRRTFLNELVEIKK